MNKARQDKGTSMHRRRVILELHSVTVFIRKDAQRLRKVDASRFAADEKTNLTRRIRCDGSRSVGHRWEDWLYFGNELLDKGQLKPVGLSLAADDATGTQSFVQSLVVGLFVKSHCRSLWIRAVGDDDVKLVLVFHHVFVTVSKKQLELGTIEATSQQGQMLLCHLDDLLINLHLHNLLHFGMLAHLSSHAAVATANDEHSLWVGMTVERQKRDGLLVSTLIQLSALDGIIEDEDTAEDIAEKGQKDVNVLSSGTISATYFLKTSMS